MMSLLTVRALFRWPPGKFLKTLIAVTGAAALGFVTWWIVDTVTPDAHPACGGEPEVRKYGQECVGISDGGYPFAPYLKDVADRIKKENNRIAKDAARHPYATVALMIPMTSDNPTARQQIQEEVQGAYVAQWRANHGNNATSPPIRLVLANPGREYARGETVADRLAAMSTSEKDRLLAVAGFNLSLDTTKQTVRRLTKTYGIPVVGGPITADDFTNTDADPERFPGLVRVAPTNQDEANALARFNRPDPKKVLIVQDDRRDDPYISTLSEAFKKQAPSARVESYRSPADIDDTSNLSNGFEGMVTNICVSEAEVIYFAGRPVQLRQFVNALKTRGCADTKRYTVISGSNASLLAEDKELDWSALSSGITIEYAALAHPDAWTTRPGLPRTGGSAQDYAGFSTALEESGLRGVSLTDSRTIIAHDSVWTAITEIRRTARGSVTMPTLDQVGRSRYNLHGMTPVKGASGWICLDNHGNTYDKAVAVVRLDPVRKSARFVDLAWPTGSPPPADCTAPE